VKRLLKNDILMFRTASSVLHILPIAGVYTFLPKYLESQFRLAAHAANMISGNVCQPLFPLASCNACNSAHIWFSTIMLQKQGSLYKGLENI
jgi:Organic Anion Transporter Polypeptide (OATP) family.